MRYGWGQDFLQNLFNEHLILQNFLGDEFQNYLPEKRRIALWCTQTVAFFFAVLLYDSPIKITLNIFVVSPVLLIVNTQVLVKSE